MRQIENPGLLRLAAPLAIVSALALGGCGERKEDTGTVTSPKAPPTHAKASAAGASGVSLIRANACLKRKGLRPTRAAGKTGTHLEVRSGGGTVSVYVFGSKTQAARKREAIAVASKTSGGPVRQIGNAVTAESSGVSPAVTAKVRACLGG